MKVIRYLQSWFHVVPAGHSEAKYEAGKHYPVTDETSLHVEHGIAELVDAPEDADKAAAAAESAEARAAKAAETAEAARAAADAAAAAADAANAAKPSDAKA
jgi:hypothetical protein